jgi:hypothetical protein
VVSYALYFWWPAIVILIFGGILISVVQYYLLNKSLLDIKDILLRMEEENKRWL